jgi:hypothetical protein
MQQEIERAQAPASDSHEPFLAALHARIADPKRRRAAAEGSFGWNRAMLAASALAALLVALLGLASLAGRAGRGDRRPTAAAPLPIASGSGDVAGPIETPRPRNHALRSSSAPPRKPAEAFAGVRTTSAVRSRTDGGFHPHSGNHAKPLSTGDPAASDDLAFLNADPVAEMRPWAPLPEREWSRVETELRERVRVQDDFVTIPLPRLAAASPRQIAAAAESYKREAAVVDSRLFREVSVGVKAIALSNLCERLTAETGISLVAGRSVADEKVTVFCQKQPLRDLMRQLSRPFGYTWLRSGTALGVGRGASGAETVGPNPQRPTPNTPYRYELVQDLKSQLLEEELRNRDRHQALLALDQEMSQYRAYVEMSPDEALAKAKTAPPEEKRRLERYAGTGWGPAQMYFRLAPGDLEQLRAGGHMMFSVGPGEQEQPLPPELARGVLQSIREVRVRQNGGLFLPVHESELAGGVPPSTVEGLRPAVTLRMRVSDLGRFTLTGGSGFGISPTPGDERHWTDAGELAVGISPTVRNPQNAVANATLASDLALRPRVSLAPGSQEMARSREPRVAATSTTERKVTSADVLEAIHRATGMPIVADYYTRLYQPDLVAVKNQVLFHVLNQLCDAMHLRWKKDGSWLQFRSASFFQDRLKEVPNRLLARWSASRKEHGALTLEDLLEISALPDAQLDAESMAEGARELHGLAEWDLARRPNLRLHLRFLAQLLPAQRQEALGRAGLRFVKLSLPQQQQFLALAFSGSADRLRSLDELSQATLRVDYSLPGAYEWRPNGRPGSPDQGLLAFEPAAARAPTREAALQAARKIDPRALETQILATELAMTLEYSLGPGSPYRPAGIRVTPLSTFNTLVLLPRHLPDGP